MRSVLHVEAANAVLVLLEVRVLIFRAWSAAEGVAAEGVVAEAVVVEAVVEGRRMMMDKLKHTLCFTR